MLGQTWLFNLDTATTLGEGKLEFKPIVDLERYRLRQIIPTHCMSSAPDDHNKVKELEASHLWYDQHLFKLKISLYNSANAQVYTVVRLD